MLLKYSISNAKKFFKNTLQNFKSFLSGGYQRLPKTPPFNPFSCGGLGDSKMHHSFRELDSFYTDFTNRWDFDDEKAKKKSSKKKATTAEKQIKKGPKEIEDICNGSFLKFAKQNPLLERTREEEEEEEEKIMLKKKERSGSNEESLSVSCCSSKKVVVREERNYNMVKQRIKEMEMVDICNVDHVLDVEEVLHYYSRLTCPAYLDMVDRFFMQIYSEFFATQSAAGNYYSSQRF